MESEDPGLFYNCATDINVSATVRADVVPHLALRALTGISDCISGIPTVATLANSVCLVGGWFNPVSAPAEVNGQALVDPPQVAECVHVPRVIQGVVRPWQSGRPGRISGVYVESAARSNAILPLP
ncbi:MAG: hypothetical protein U9Q70_07245 [Chloroflexota bacterium]|nr:hypothetical protein [Chloroflexota bacterium]